ncbi:4'-phosphopantetheinyl transferase [Alcanivorax sp. DP30]|uniref:4'-phosphopantetheinyl transferase family protein n=1 Tax=Alcanivorax sp. DP30 TaxID=2606217 RepID=UPI00136FDB2C|nr:4'-phosphopantetheinyl transferase superfamily protein [Alcanivorax sp. DP30]MZR63577.1 4'-phosphopantetheinyl transferase superfamily protein [Alcanivorax sp. DP30]
MPASSSQRPACLTQFNREELSPGLIRVSCHYFPERLESRHFQEADITLPPSLQTAVNKRKAEYLAGRWCGREALRQIGSDGVPGFHSDRSPVWPVGTLGSITHSHGIAEVMVGDARHWLTVGLDTEQWVSPERAARLERELLTEEELKTLAGMSPLQRANRLTLIFSAKESLFKALYPLTGKRFYFHDAVRRQPNSLTLLRTLSPEWPKGTQIPFRWRERQHSVLSWIALPRNS